jgi:hypothetical protein
VPRLERAADAAVEDDPLGVKQRRDPAEGGGRLSDELAHHLAADRVAVPGDGEDVGHVVPLTQRARRPVPD